MFSFSKYSMFIFIVVRRKFECFLRNCVVKRFKNCSLLITIITKLNFHLSSFDWQFERDRCHKLSLIQSIAHTNWLKTKLFYKWFRIFRSCFCCRKIKINMFCWHVNDFNIFVSNNHFVHDLNSIYNICENFFDDAQYNCLFVCCLKKNVIIKLFNKKYFDNRHDIFV